MVLLKSFERFLCFEFLWFILLCIISCVRAENATVEHGEVRDKSTIGSISVPVTKCM